MGDSGKDATMDNQQATPVDLSWIACFLDGEGTISIAVNHMKRQRNAQAGQWMRPQIDAHNCDLRLIEHARKIFTKLGCVPYALTVTPSNGRARKAFSVRIQSLTGAAQVLPPIIPYLVAKTKQAELVLEFCQRRLSSKARGRYHPYGPREIAIMEEVHLLNRRGVLRGHEQDTLTGEDMVQATSESRG